MTFFSNLYQRILGWRRPKPPATMEERLSWLLRPYLAILEDILLWKNPSVSFGFFIFSNILLWILRSSEVRLLGLVGCVLTVGAVLDGAATWLGASGRARGSTPSRTGSPPHPPHRLREAAQQTSQHISTVCQQLAQLREENHSKFCVVISCGIVSMWLVLWMGGDLLLHGALSALLLSPLLHKVPTLIHHHADSDGEMEGFLPELSPVALEELHQAGELPHQPLSITSDFSIPPDEVSAALRYASGETSSSDEEDVVGRMRGRTEPTTDDLPSTDSTDSDTEFLLHERRKKISSDKPNDKSSWLSSMGIRPSAPPQKDSDSDEFELIDKDDL